MSPRRRKGRPRKARPAPDPREAPRAPALPVLDHLAVEHMWNGTPYDPDWITRFF